VPLRKSETVESQHAVSHRLLAVTPGFAPRVVQVVFLMDVALGKGDSGFNSRRGQDNLACPRPEQF
jgi:hypothetical protein